MIHRKVHSTSIVTNTIRLRSNRKRIVVVRKEVVVNIVYLREIVMRKVYRTQ